MKNKNNFNTRLRPAQSIINQTMKLMLLGAVIISCLQIPLQAQEAQEVEYTRPSWWFGGAVGVNFNYYEGTTQRLNDGLIIPNAFRHGSGLGLYAAPLVEFYRPDSRFGAMLQVGYDSRRGDFDQITTSCNCPADLSTSLSYLTVEPSLRIAPFKSNLYIYGGPRLAFNLDKSFTYNLRVNPNFPNQTPNPEVKGDFSNIEKTLISMQVGAGYDIPISSQNKRTQFVLSPFVSFHPYFGAEPRSSETWTLTTVRAGFALKFGRGKEVKAPVRAIAPYVAPAPEVWFTVDSPRNIAVDRRVRETFPLRNYVFFDLGSTKIPDRYVLLQKSQVKDFKEDQLEVFTPKALTGAAKRQMVVYYNVLNILGDRMGKNPGSTITLVGSSEKGPEDGRAMAESTKKYLVDIFGIQGSRIAVEGRTRSKIASEKVGATLDLALLREEDRRVSIESSSPALLMEFQSGPDAPLKPVDLAVVQEAPLDSYVTFHAKGAQQAFSSWTMRVEDDKGRSQSFGPYTQDKIALPGKTLLGTNSKGDYKITMVGQTRRGATVTKDANAHMVLWKVSENEQGMRFSVLFEFDDSRPISIYEKYLTEVVAPKITKGATVIIHGHTDIVGNAEHNLKLSEARANDVKNIIEKALSKANRKDVNFKVYGFGKDTDAALFSNKLPEGRFYNRIVFIDIIPAK